MAGGGLSPPSRHGGCWRVKMGSDPIYRDIRLKLFIEAAVALLAVLPLSGALADLPDPLFRDDATLRVELTAPLARIIRERAKDEELAGTFSFRNPDGSAIELDVRVRARGNFRHANCDFPPLQLNFRRSQVEGTLFDQQNKLKMVVHCKDSLRYEQSVVREYLAYRMLNEVSDQSFRVRLLQITYVDSDGRRGRMVRSAFLIESEDRLANRLGMEKRDLARTEVGALQPAYLNLTSMFQYLLGNTDFSPILGSNNECCHNYALFGKGDDPLLAIPYDFDLAGFVYAPYAEPDDDLGIDSVRQRLYRGFCANNRYIEASIAEFLQARDALYALVADQQELESTVRRNIADYLDEFYATIGDSGAVEREIVGRCIP